MTTIDTTAVAAPTTVSAKTAKQRAATAAAAERMETTTFGIEIETVGRARSVVAGAVASVVAPTSTAFAIRAVDGYMGDTNYEVTADDGRVWIVMRDGSLAGGGAEIVSPILKGAADVALLQAVVRAVRATGARSTSADNCGIHVHVGLVDAAPVVVARLAKLTHRVDAVVRQAIAIDPARAGYAKPLPEAFVRNVGNPATRDALMSAWSRHVGGGYYRPSRYDNTRYHGCNLNSWFVRGTAEFRYFNGTLHAGEIRSYVTLCLALVAKAHAGAVSTTPLKVRNGNVRGAFYAFLLHHGGLGLKGDAYKAVLHHLTKHLPGDAPSQARAAARAVA